MRATRARWIMQEVENSLRRLGTDHIDLYQIHRPTRTPTSRRRSARSPICSVRARSASFGSSTFPADRSSRRSGWPSGAGCRGSAREQPPYSIFVAADRARRAAGRQRYGMGVLMWSPLCRGWLTGRYRAEDGRPNSRIALIAQASRRSLRSHDESSPRSNGSSTWSKQLIDAGDKAGHADGAHGDGVRAGAPGGDVGDHRPAHAEQLDDLLGAPTCGWTRRLLDAIDELVPPGTNVNPIDVTSRPLGLRKPARRRSAVAR